MGDDPEELKTYEESGAHPRLFNRRRKETEPPIDPLIVYHISIWILDANATKTIRLGYDCAQNVLFCARVWRACVLKCLILREFLHEPRATSGINSHSRRFRLCAFRHELERC